MNSWPYCWASDWHHHTRAGSLSGGPAHRSHRLSETTHDATL